MDSNPAFLKISFYHKYFGEKNKRVARTRRSLFDRARREAKKESRHLES